MADWVFSRQLGAATHIVDTVSYYTVVACVIIAPEGMEMVVVKEVDASLKFYSPITFP